MRISDQEAARLRVLKAIRRAEPVARTQLVELTGLGSQAISDLVADLLRRGLLVEQKTPAAGRGRPRILLRIDPDAARVVGAFLFPDQTLGVEIANLRGDRLFGRSFRLNRTATVEELACEIAASVEAAIAESPLDKAAIDSVGLGLPAVVDNRQGVLHWLPGYPPRAEPFAALVGERLQLPVFLDSSADVLTRAEHWFGEDRQVDDFALIFVGFGLGLAQYVDGLLHTGGHGASPAFAHVKMAIGQGPRCICGGEGCLMTYSSLSGLVRRISQSRGQDPPQLAQMQPALHAFAAEARAGDAAAQAAFDLAGTALGVAAANYVNLCDPGRLVVLVQDPVLLAMIEAPFRAALEANTLPVLRDRAPPQVRLAEELAFAKGAAAVVLERLYRRP